MKNNQFSISKRDKYYIHHRLRSLGIGVAAQKKTVSLTAIRFAQLKRKDRKKIENLGRIGYNVQIELF